MGRRQIRNVLRKMKKKIYLITSIMVMLALMGCGKDKKTGNNFFELDNPQKVEVYDSCYANEPPIEVTDQKVIAEICDLIQSAKMEEGGSQGEGGFGVKVICKSKEYDFVYSANGIMYKDKHYDITNDIDLLNILYIAEAGNSPFRFIDPTKIEVLDTCGATDPPIVVTDQEQITKICHLIQSAELESGGEPGEGGFSLKIVCKDKTYEIGCAGGGITYDGEHYDITNSVDLTAILEIPNANDKE